MRDIESGGVRPRFPFVGALLCAACVGTAAWLWFRYSYCYAVTPDLAERLAAAASWPRPENRIPHSIAARYVEFKGVPACRLRHRPSHGRQHGPVYWLDGTPLFWHIPVMATRGRECVLVPSRADWEVGDPRVLDSAAWREGRLCYRGRVRRGAAPACGHMPDAVTAPTSTRFAAAVDADAGRFTGASAAGLVVAAWGTFVFGVALRHWAAERRRHRQEAARPASSR